MFQPLKSLCGSILVLSLGSLLITFAVASSERPAGTDVVFQEKDGVLAIEAEHFLRQTKTELRQWHLTTAERHPEASHDADPPHVQGASGGAYLEILPDTRHNHGHRLIRGENFSPQPGQLGVLHYRAHFTHPGRYHVWVRAYSTGTEDNGIHVGLNGEWPESGQRMQWCEGKRSWRWESKQRTEANHCGEPYKIYLDVPTAGEHTIQFSMREDGFEFDKFLLTLDRDAARPEGAGPAPVVHSGSFPRPFAIPAGYRDPAAAGQAATPTQARASSRRALVQPRSADGDGSVSIGGEMKQWHKVTLTLDGPFAHERDNDPNPFTDREFIVTFTHESGSPQYTVPGYFAADGNAAETSAESGTQWRAHLSPDKPGVWRYEARLLAGKGILSDRQARAAARPLYSASGRFDVAPTDKTGRDLRGRGRLQYVGERYLRFAGDGEYFLKAGADAPETFLGYADFDGTVAGKPDRVPLKTWEPHQRDWRPGDPTWKGGKGKGMIGAINYLSGKGCNVFSFLTYNAGGDGDNVWPFVSRNDKMHYDCSKLDQWQIVLDHGTAQGMYLHFKMQETEMDDNTRGGHEEGRVTVVPTSLNGGDLGPERMLYCRELVARFGHELALNWNLGEENTQTTAQQVAMINYIRDLDPYDHPIVVHTFPNQQDKVYRALIGDKSHLTGTSLQNSSIEDTHWQTVKWVTESNEAGKPWVVAFDESGSAAHAQCPDLGYRGYDGHDADGKMTYTEHEVRKYTLWGQLMGGGAGVEYYFGYKYAENDLVCEDWRSRDRSWDYCRHALSFFHKNDVPFAEMRNANRLIGNAKNDNSKYCFAKEGSVYVIYLPDGGTTELDLGEATGEFQVRWYNPREGGTLLRGSVTKVNGGRTVSIGQAVEDRAQDWVVLVQR